MATNLITVNKNICLANENSRLRSTLKLRDRMIEHQQELLHQLRVELVQLKPLPTMQAVKHSAALEQARVERMLCNGQWP